MAARVAGSCASAGHEDKTNRKTVSLKRFVVAILIKFDSLINIIC